MAKTAMWTMLKDARLAREVMFEVFPDGKRARVKLDGGEFLLGVPELNEMLAMLTWVKNQLQAKPVGHLEGEHNIPFP